MATTKATIDVWQFIPEPIGSEPGFLTYRVAGLIDGKPYCCNISVEIDGRDVECDRIWGVSLTEEDGTTFFSKWDAFLAALDKTPQLEGDMFRRSTEFYENA
jgi:hypothetical protein